MWFTCLVRLCNDVHKDVAYIMTEFDHNLFTPKMRFRCNFNFQIEYNIHAHVLLNLLKSFRNSHKILSKPHILSLPQLIKINIIIQEHSC